MGKIIKSQHFKDVTTKKLQIDAQNHQPERKTETD